MDPLAGLILHHASATAIALEIAAVVAVGGLLAAVWWRGRARRADHRRAVAEMRDDADGGRA